WRRSPPRRGWTVTRPGPGSTTTRRRRPRYRPVLRNGRRADASSALRERHERQILRAGVVTGGPDDLAIGALLDHVRGPSCGARDDEQRGEHGGGHAHHVIADRGVPVE